MRKSDEYQEVLILIILSPAVVHEFKETLMIFFDVLLYFHVFNTQEQDFYSK